jgi:type II secretory pathway pseudopilin PulG
MRTAQRARGMTVLEVIAALAVLAGVASMVTGVLQFQRRAAEIDRTRLAAAEAAHRLILQYIEDSRSVENARAPVEIDGELYDFTLRVDVLISRGSGDDGAPARREARDAAAVPIIDLLTNRLKRVTIRSWPADQRFAFGPDNPAAELTRTYDVLVNQEQLIEDIMQGTAEQRDNR